MQYLGFTNMILPGYQADGQFLPTSQTFVEEEVAVDSMTPEEVSAYEAELAARANGNGAPPAGAMTAGVTGGLGLLLILGLLLSQKG